MSRHFRRSFRPQLEALEDRCTPAGTVTGSFADGVWTLTGDGASNAIIVNSTGVAGACMVTGTATTVAGDTNPTGVKAIVFDMGDGDDSIFMNGNSTPIRIKTLTVNGGDGNNRFEARQLTVKKTVRVTNGIGFDVFRLEDFHIKKSLVIDNGAGGSATTLRASSAAFGFNTIGRHLKVFNDFTSTQDDDTTVHDTHVGGNVINGNGGRLTAGVFRLANVFQTAARAVIGGDVRISFVNGLTVVADIGDVKVKGDVTINMGSGDGITVIDGQGTPLPVVIKGDLTVNGTGPNDVNLGVDREHTGLTVGGDLHVKSVDGPALEAFNLTVKGKTQIA